MKRLFWLAMGVTVGALVVRKLSRTAGKLSPRAMSDGIAGVVADLTDAVQEFRNDVRSAMVQREAELRAGTGLDGDLGAKP